MKKFILVTAIILILLGGCSSANSSDAKSKCPDGYVKVALKTDAGGYNNAYVSGYIQESDIVLFKDGDIKVIEVYGYKGKMLVNVDRIGFIYLHTE